MTYALYTLAVIGAWCCLSLVVAAAWAIAHDIIRKRGNR